MSFLDTKVELGGDKIKFWRYNKQKWSWRRRTEEMKKNQIH
jgi:hypothetical protein